MSLPHSRPSSGFGPHLSEDQSLGKLFRPYEICFSPPITWLQSYPCPPPLLIAVPWMYQLGFYLTVFHLVFALPRTFLPLLSLIHFTILMKNANGEAFLPTLFQRVTSPLLWWLLLIIFLYSSPWQLSPSGKPYPYLVFVHYLPTPVLLECRCRM